MGAGHRQREQASDRDGHQHAEDDDQREFHVAVEREEDQQDQHDGQRDDDQHLRPRGEVFLVFAAPVVGIAEGERDRIGHFLPCFLDGAGQVAVLDAELDADEARVVLAVDERGALVDPDVRELAERQVLAVRCRDQQVLDRVEVLTEWLLEPDDEVELALPLDHLRGRGPADRGFDQRIDVRDVQPVAGDQLTVRFDRQARLSELAHQGDAGDAGNGGQHFAHRFGLALERLQTGPEDLDGERALQPGLRLVHRILGRLREVEDDPGKGVELLLDRVHELGLRT